MKGGIEDFMIRFPVAEYFTRVKFAALIHYHPELALGGAVEGYPVLQCKFTRQFIQETDKLPCLNIDGVVPFFKIIQFFQNCNGYGYIMLFKIVDRVMIIKDY